MSEDTPPGDKPYDPTPARLEEARKKGEIVRSSDLNTAIVYGGFLLVLALFGATLGQQIGSRLAVLLDQRLRKVPRIRAPLAPLALGGTLPKSGTLLPGAAIPHWRLRRRVDVLPVPELDTGQ